MKNILSRQLLNTAATIPALLALALSATLSFSANSSALELDVVSLTKLSETRITRTEYDYVFAVTVKNGSQVVTNAAQTLTSSGPGTSIIDGSVILGDLAANAQVTPADTIKIRHDRSIPFNQSAFVWSASGTVASSSSSAANRTLLNEVFSIDKATLFSAAYRSISTDASAPLLFVTGGNSGITITNNELTLAAARFTIGHKPPRANTTASDTNANGDFDLSKPYRISFRVLASSGSGALQVMVDNNTTSAGSSLHGSASRIFNAAANSLVAGQTVVLTPSVGTATSFISVRTESSASVTIDDLVIEYLDDVVNNSSAPSSIPASSKSSVAISTSSNSATSISTSSSSNTSAAPVSSSTSSKSSSSFASYNGAIRAAKMEGFAAHAAVTGGQGGPVITVSTGTQLNAALCSRSTKTDPIIILVDGTINHSNTTAQGCNTQADVIEIKQMSNISIIGVGTNALFDEMGIHIRDASNIIIQNVHIRNVKKSGSPTSNGGDAIGMETNVNRVWIDHNHLEASGGEKDGYDSLLDMKAGVTNVTVSYNLYNDSSRAGLIGSSDSDDKNTNITFHHNWYKNIEQRTPLIRHALVHMYNNYWSNDRMDYMFHAINSRMNAKALVESNYFYNVNNPLIASDDSNQPGCWQTNNENTVLPSIYYSRTVGNGALVIPEVVDGQLQSTCSVNVPYSVAMDHSSEVPAIVMANAGVGKVSYGDTGNNSSVAVSSAATSNPVSSTASSVTSSNASSTGVIQNSSSSVASSEAPVSESSSSQSSVINSALINEAFNTDKTTLFSASYKAISTDASAALYFITGGASGITIANNELSLVGGRLTVGHRPPRASTTASDTNANGDFDLSRPYRISFTIVAASGSGKLQVYVDNNTTSQGNSIHGANSKVFEAVASSLVAGQRIEISRTVGTANSFFALRTESSASVTIDNLVLEYTDGAGVSSSSQGSVSTSSQASSQSLSSVLSTSSAVATSSVSSSVSSSSASSSAPYIPVDVNLSADCIRLATNRSVNWRDTALQTDQEIVECLYQTLGTPVGYGENAKGGYDPNGNSKLTVITKNSSKSVEQQLLEAITGEEHNWIVFDKIEFAQPYEIGMYRLGCSNATVQSILGATESECVNYQQWCSKNSVSPSACVSTFFNTAMNKSNNPIRNPVIGSNKSIDGRMNEAYFLFSGFAIGKDSTGTPTQTATSVILTHLNFKGAGHTEDHYVDPDMIRSTGASHDIWIHKNTFDTTGDSAFDVKVGAYGITMSFNKILDVKRATLHSSSDSHTIDSQIRTTMHHNLFVTRDASYTALGNTLRRVPLIRRGTSHMLNNVFVNYRKDLLSIRVGASILQEDNMFVINRIHQEKSSLAASLAELQGNLIKDINGGNYRGEGIYLWFADGACNLDETTKTQITAASGTVANLALQYNAASQTTLNAWRFSAGQELEDYVSATAGREGAIPFNSPLAADRYYALPAIPCQ